MQTSSIHCWFSLLVSLTVAACSSNEQPVGKLTQHHGSVQVDAKHVPTHGVVHAGQTIALGDDAWADLQLLGAGTVRLFANSSLKIKERKALTAIELTTGKIWIAITQALGERQFEVETKNAVAGVRGTEFIVETTDDYTEVRVRKGAVHTTTRKYPKKGHTLQAGQKCRVLAGSPPNEPERYQQRDDDQAWNRLRHGLRQVRDSVREGLQKSTPRLKKGIQQGGEDAKEHLRRLLQNKNNGGQDRQ